MDMGISGKTAIVCASSRGLGRACAESLAEAGVNVFINGRSAADLAEIAADMSRRHGVTVTPIAADVTTDEGQQLMVNACPAPDILVNNANGPAPADWRSFERADWHAAVDANMLSAIFLIRAYADGMAERGFGRIVNITSSLVKMPLDVISLSVAARLGLIGFCKGIAQQLVSKGVTINSMLPEQFETSRLQKNLKFLAERNSRSLEEETAHHLASNPAARFGRPEEFGATCAFLCSAYAGYITGQSIMLDGGRYPGVF